MPNAKLFTLAQITVATSGTEQQVSATDLFAGTVIISAPAANTGAIYVGDSNVATTRGIEVAKGTSVSISADMLGRASGMELNLADLYIDAATNGDKANVSYIKVK